MRTTTSLSVCLALTALGCASEESPTGPAEDQLMIPAGSVLAAASNSWTTLAPPPSPQVLFGQELGVAPNQNGRTIVYTFGGTDGEGLSGTGVRTYNPTNGVWSGKLSKVYAFQTNGVARIGNRLYFSGGYDYGVGFKAPLKAVYAYDYVQDRMIQRASLPIFSSEGVTGAIDGKLYVLPGACSGDNWPNPDSCETEATRRFYRYDPASNAWQTMAPSPHFHRGGAATVLGGKLYVVGGVGEGQIVQVKALDVYDPKTNTWKTLALIPTGGRAVGAAIAGTFFVVVRGSPNRAYAYNPANNRWTVKAAPEISGPLAKVEVNGAARLFTTDGAQAALYTP